jgi:hypothetical protein
MVTQYPHTIIVYNRATPVQNTSTGKFTVSTPVSFTSECRAEPNGKGTIIRGADGVDTSFEFIVYMPVTGENLKFGSDVVITLENGVQHRSTLKRQHNGQLNSRLWV